MDQTPKLRITSEELDSQKNIGSVSPEEEASLVDVLMKIKASQHNVLDTLKEISIQAFSLDAKIVVGVLEGLKDVLRTGSSSMSKEEMDKIRDNLRMVTALRNFKTEVDPILTKIVSDKTEADFRKAQLLSKAGQ